MRSSGSRPPPQAHICAPTPALPRSPLTAHRSPGAPGTAAATSGGSGSRPLGSRKRESGSDRGVGQGRGEVTRRRRGFVMLRPRGEAWSLGPQQTELPGASALGWNYFTDEKIDIKKEFATKCRPDCTPPSCLHSLPPCLFMMQVSQGKAQHLQLERKNWLSPACDFRSFLGPWCPGLSAFGQLPVCLGIRIPTYSAPEAPPDPILPSLKAGGR
ncbi:uncharacterized protein LOC107978277 [Cricetulus griseus]|uniref:Uncharacterized protein LOC107978277 n=1 Tax=Cricetulus griseus TaxID=10029 RepID=A0A9J7JWA0_CRIGR|nr:uncharacterized protein LOC107978277 [Cricetulus griseus]XP_035316698.1 uncharacterized protein LOC107978277 [Cricetulus griseus]